MEPWSVLLAAFAVAAIGICGAAPVSGAVALPAPLDGPARVIDGDTIEVGGRVVRLFGIDAPELLQTCGGRGRRPYHCGRDAAAVLRDLTRDRRVECQPSGRDRHNRVVAVCRTEAGDINAAMVRQGWAVENPRYSRGRYRMQQKAARAERRGIWSGRFTMPWTWREQHRPADRSRPDRGWRRAIREFPWRWLRP